MPKRSYIPILWLWMTALLLSTVGFSVQQIYCYCLGETAISIFIDAEDPCGAMLPDESACCESGAITGCCSREDNALEPLPCCSEKSVNVHSLKAEFTIGQPFQKSFDCPLWADELPAFLRLYRQVICDASLLNKAPPEPPPPLSGRLLCLRHENFRC